MRDDSVPRGPENHRGESAGSLEVVKSQRERLAVLVVLKDWRTAALDGFSLFLLFALLHLLRFVGTLFPTSPFLRELCKRRP